MTRMMQFILFLVSSFFMVSTQASITLGGTRLIYDGAEREAPISVSNGQKAVPHLIQSWVEVDGEPSAKAPFIVTPPLFRLDGGRENTLRVIYNAGVPLPDNRESVFWLNVKSIPAVEKSEQNRLLIAVKTRIKLFYRPATLNTDAAASAWKQLTFKRNGNQLTISNPTPYYVSLYSLKSGSQEIENPPMIAPSGSAVVTGAGGRVSWKAINDYGGITEEAHQTL
ncbi:fimbrial biogenesis chaperone [Enterobacter hormaechei]